MNQKYNYNMYNNYKINDKKNKKLPIILLIILLSFFIIGALVFKFIYDIFKPTQVPTEREVKQYISKNIGDNDLIISKEKVIDTENTEHPDKGYTYVIKSHLGFTYEVKAIITYTDNYPFGYSYSKYFSSNFLYRLVEEKKDEFDNIINKYPSIDVDYSSDEEKKSTIDIKINLQNNLNNITDSYNLSYEIKDLLKNEFKIKNCEQLSIEINYNSSVKPLHIEYTKLNTYDKEIEIEAAKQYFIKDEINLDYTLYKPTYIKKLFINGEEFKSKHEMLFVYNPYYKEYLATYTYYETNDNMEELITKYLGGTFEVKDELTKYQIGNNKYEINFPFDSARLRKNFYFKKNGKNTNIKLVDSPLYYGSSHYYYFKLSDMALSLECNYEVINDTIYLKSK